MSDKEKIKQGIERRIEMYKGLKPVRDQFYLGQISAAKGILQFINSLSEEPASEDLEEYYKKEFLPNEWFAKSGQRTISQFNFFTARHFAEWQKKQDNICYKEIFEEGAKWQKQQMIKDAVECIVCNGIGDRYLKEVNKDSISAALTNFQFDDKVKIIIVKED